MQAESSIFIELRPPEPSVQNIIIDRIGRELTVLNSHSHHIQNGDRMSSAHPPYQDRDLEETPSGRHATLIIILLAPFLAFIMILMFISQDVTAALVLAIIAAVTVVGVTATIRRGHKEKAPQPIAASQKSQLVRRPQPAEAHEKPLKSKPSPPVAVKSLMERLKGRRATVSEGPEEPGPQISRQYKATTAKPVISHEGYPGYAPETLERGPAYQETPMVRFCWRCGRSVMEGAWYCDLCGANLR